MSADDRFGVAALRQAAEIGPFFALAVDPQGSEWIPFAAFAANRRQVSEAIATTREQIARGLRVVDTAVEFRVAASVWQLGLTARIASPMLGAAAVAGWAPRLDGLLWLDAADGPGLAVRTRDVSGTQLARTSQAAAVLADGVEEVLAPLMLTVAEVASVSARVLWGNVWSAFAGAAAVIAAARPTSGPAAREIVTALVAGQPLAGRYEDAGRFRRGTCCLYYRLPRGGLCGDCVLDRMPPARHERTEST